MGAGRPRERAVAAGAPEGPAIQRGTTGRLAAAGQVLDVVLGVVVDGLRVRFTQRVRGAMLGRLVLAHGNAEDEVTFAKMLGIPARVFGVVAEHVLRPALDGACQSVPLARDVDPAGVTLPLQRLVAVGCETACAKRSRAMFSAASSRRTPTTLPPG